jgi:hypothetical protein
MTPLLAVTYSFLFGLLHGILPDEHTWPITFSYAIGSGGSRQGMKAGFFFSVAFTIQRAILSELSYLALARFLLNPTINGYIYILVGAAMAIAGAIVVRRNVYVHLHIFGHRENHSMSLNSEKRDIHELPVKWTLIHGFIAGFGIGGFSIFVNTVAAPAMGSAWIAFLPGMLYGFGTMLMLLIIGGLFGASLRWAGSLTNDEIRRIGAQTGGRTLFFGGLLFTVAGIAMVLGLSQKLPVDTGHLLIALFMVGVAVPAFVYSYREVMAARRQSVSPDNVD